MLPLDEEAETEKLLKLIGGNLSIKFAIVAVSFSSQSLKL